MSKTMTKSGLHKAFALGGAFAMSAGLASMVSAPEAQAYNGKEDPGTGIVWGVGQDGSYMVPLVSGGEKQGWCIDPGAAYPKQGSPVKYGKPTTWGKGMSASDKKKIGVALIIGKGIESGQINSQTIKVIDSINGALNSARGAAQKALDTAKSSPLPEPAKGMAVKAAQDALNKIPKGGITKDVNKLAAGVSGVVHDVGQRNANDSNTTKPPYTKPWNPGRITDPEARFVYNLISKYSNLIPNAVLPQVSFSVRESVDHSRQRMVLMDDIKIDFNSGGFDLNLPPIPNTPGREDDKATPPTKTTNKPSTTPSTTTPTSSETTETPSTTPETTSETTPSTTSETTTPSSTTTPSKEKEKDKPEIRTSAGTKSENVVDQGKTITDTVTYKNLEPGETYKLTGETVNKENGEKDGNKGEIEFTPKTANGRVDVPIKLDKVEADQLVVFESLAIKKKDKWDEVATHEDVDDQAQTVGRIPRNPQIGTSADSSTGNFIQTGTTVNDTVRFQGLTPGKNYRLEARLMCKATGEDTGAVANHEFTPDKENGQTVVQGIEVTNPDCLEQVVFEKLYDDKGLLVASHEDINDAAQTFGGEQPAKKKKKTPTPEKPAPKPQPKPEAPMAVANADANADSAPAPAPLGAAPASGGGGGAGGAGGAGGGAPRQVIGSVPSGDYSVTGSTLFNR